MQVDERCGYEWETTMTRPAQTGDGRHFDGLLNNLNDIKNTSTSSYVSACSSFTSHLSPVLSSSTSASTVTDTKVHVLDPK